MSFLLDTNIVTVHLKRPSGLIHRFVQHAGRLFIPSIVLGELYAWAYHRSDPEPVRQAVEDLIREDLVVLDFDADCARTFGRVRGQLLRVGRALSRLDLMIAAVALVHDLTLVTHNTRHVANIDGLSLDDWWEP